MIRTHLGKAGKMDLLHLAWIREKSIRVFKPYSFWFRSSLNSIFPQLPFLCFPVGPRLSALHLTWDPFSKPYLSLSHFLRITSLLSHVLVLRAFASIWSANLCQNVNHSWFKSFVLSFIFFKYISTPCILNTKLIHLSDSTLQNLHDLTQCGKRRFLWKTTIHHSQGLSLLCYWQSQQVLPPTFTFWQIPPVTWSKL